MMSSAALRGLVAVAAVSLGGCGALPALSAPTSSPVSRQVALGAYPVAFVGSVHGGSGAATQGLAVFASSDGRLVRWLVHSASYLVPVVVSPGGRWVYYYYPPAPRRACPSSGFTEPVLWRVSTSGGRPQRVGISTTNMAFSPDGTMVAYTSTRGCGRTLLVVVRNQRTGVTRRIVAARNNLSGNAPVFEAQLSWAPDDVHLAVAEAPAAAVNTLTVINTRRETVITGARPISPCAAPQTGCLDPGFDIHGRLTFLEWHENSTRPAEWAVRWHSGRVTALFRLSKAVAFAAAIAVDRTGTAILLESYLRQPEIWRSGGSLAPLRHSTRRLVVSPLWLSR